MHSSSSCSVFLICYSTFSYIASNLADRACKPCTLVQNERLSMEFVLNLNILKQSAYVFWRKLYISTIGINIELLYFSML
jgi:hypothetical protein